MYSEYTARFTHSIQFMCILYDLYCIVHIDYIYSRVVIESVISRAKCLYTILYTKIKTTFMTLKIVDNTK